MNWNSLARRVSFYHTDDYERRCELVSDMLYDILVDWRKREHTWSSPRCLWRPSREGSGGTRTDEGVGLEQWSVRHPFV